MDSGRSLILMIRVQNSIPKITPVSTTKKGRRYIIMAILRILSMGYKVQRVHRSVQIGKKCQMAKHPT